MAGIGPDETRTLARLAKLSLDDSEVDLYGAQLEKILGYIESLQSVDTSGVPAHVGHVPEHSSLRPDVIDVDGDAQRPREQLVRDILAGVPHHRGTQVVVPKIKDAD